MTFDEWYQNLPPKIKDPDFAIKGKGKELLALTAWEFGACAAEMELCESVAWFFEVYDLSGDIGIALESDTDFWEIYENAEFELRKHLKKRKIKKGAP